jgi:hypothetical protein
MAAVDRSVRRFPRCTHRQPRVILPRRGHGPFDGFNRPAKISQGLIRNWWRQRMMGGDPRSETNVTADLKAIDVSVLLLHGEDSFRAVSPGLDAIRKIIRRRPWEL